MIKEYYHDIDMNANQLFNSRLHNISTAARIILGNSLSTSDKGYMVYDTDLFSPYFWDGTQWLAAGGSGPTPSLQQVVNVSNGISNFGGIGNASIQSTNFTNGRTLYLNDNAYPTIRLVDNVNASNFLQIDLDTLNIDGTSYSWSSIVNPPIGVLSALPFTTDHLATTNNQYIIGDVVWYLGNVYRCIANNDSLQPNLAPQYWTLIGAGSPLVQQPADWNSTSGNNQILNKPIIPAAQIQSDWTQSNNTLLDYIKNKPTIPAAQVNSDWNATTGLAEILNKPIIPTVGTWGALNYPTWVSGTPFVKMTAAGTFALDTTSYQPLLTNPVTGTGTATRVAFWDTSSSISSDADLYWDNVNKRLGIGTTTPAYKLDVNGEINTNTGVRVAANGAKTGIYPYDPYGGGLDFYAAGNRLATFRLTNPGGQFYMFDAGHTYNNSFPQLATASMRVKGDVSPTGPNSVDITQLLIDPQYVQEPSGNLWGTGTLRGIYYNPTVTSLNTSTHIAFENTRGDNAFNSGSGKTSFFGQDLQIEKNPSGYTGYSRIYSGPSLIIGGDANYNDTSKPYLTLGVVGGNNMIANSVLIRNQLGDVSQSASGTYTNTQISGRILSVSGSPEHRFLDIRPSYDDNGAPNTYTGTIRGIYYNLTKSTPFPAGASNIAWENVNGDIIHGNLATGGADQMVTADSSGKLKIQTIPTGNAGTVTNVGAGTGMNFTAITTSGNVAIDTAKVPYYSGGFSTGLAKYNGSAWTFDTNTYLTSITSSDVTTALGYTPVTNARTLTINGTSYDLTANRSWTIPTFTTPLTTKGDIYVRNASADTRLPVGLDTQILIADSTTSTGLKWGTNTATTPTGYYGAFQDNTSQTAASINTAYAVKLNTTDLTNGVTVVNDGSSNPTRITLANTGIYNIQFSLQLEKTGGSGNMIADIWIRKNGVDIPSTTGKVVLTGSANASPVVAAWNYVLDLVAGDYIQLMWSTSNTNVEIVAAVATSPHPAIPSAILTVTQQSGIMAGTGISRGVYSVSSNTTAGSGANVDYVYLVSGTTTITLPTAVGNTNRYTIKRSGAGVVSIATTSSQTIDGSSSPININVRYVSIDLISNGANWEII